MIENAAWIVLVWWGGSLAIAYAVGVRRERRRWLMARKRRRYFDDRAPNPMETIEDGKARDRT